MNNTIACMLAGIIVAGAVVSLSANADPSAVALQRYASSDSLRAHGYIVYKLPETPDVQAMIATHVQPRPNAQPPLNNTAVRYVFAVYEPSSVAAPAHFVALVINRSSVADESDVKAMFGASPDVRTADEVHAIAETIIKLVSSKKCTKVIAP